MTKETSMKPVKSYSVRNVFKAATQGAGLALLLGSGAAFALDMDTTINPASMNGKMIGAGTFGDDPTVSHEFVLHCDINARPNRLRVNWRAKDDDYDRGRGHADHGKTMHFHLMNLEQVRCYDDPAIDTGKPKANFDTYEGEGIGTLDGKPGYGAEWVLTDAGDPGRKNDTASILIKDGDGNVVLDVSVQLISGNHRAYGAVTPVATYHYYTGRPTGSSAVGGLYSVSSASPATPATVDTNALAIPNRTATVFTATLGPTPGLLTNLHTYAVVFVAGGHIYKQRADSAPAPVQISSESTIGTGLGDGSGSTTDLCSVSTIPDLANPENSVVTYTLAGADSRCDTPGDNNSAWLRLSTGATIAPTPLTYQPIVRPVWNDAGVLINFLALDSSGALVKLDADFATPAVIAAGPYTAVQSLGMLSMTKFVLLFRRSADTVGTLRIVDAGAAPGITGVLGTIANAPAWDVGHGVFDADYFYFVDNNSSGVYAGVIQRFALNPPAVATNFFDVSAWAGESIEVLGMMITSGRVVFMGRTAGGSEEIVSITKSGTDPRIIAAPSGSELISTMGVSSTGIVYYTRGESPTASTYRAQAVSDDGLATVTYGAPNGAVWNGFHLTSAQNLFTSTPHLDRLVMAEGLPAATDMAGATLSIVSAADAARAGTLGTVPSDFTYIWGAGRGARALWTGYDAADSEIFYVDLDVANSLTRVTNDSVDQVPILDHIEVGSD
jgi:hypothetical protein